MLHPPLSTELGTGTTLVALGTGEAVLVAFGVAVAVGVLVGTADAVGVAVLGGVGVEVGVFVGVAVSVGVGAGAQMPSTQTRSGGVGQGVSLLQGTTWHRSRKQIAGGVQSVSSPVHVGGTHTLSTHTRGGGHSVSLQLWILHTWFRQI